MCVYQLQPGLLQARLQLIYTQTTTNHRTFFSTHYTMSMIYAVRGKLPSKTKQICICVYNFLFKINPTMAFLLCIIILSKLPSILIGYHKVNLGSLSSDVFLPSKYQLKLIAVLTILITKYMIISMVSFKILLCAQ